MSLHRSLLAALALCATASLAQAQMPAMPGGGQQDMARTMHLAAHNQLGVLEYCKAQGNVGQDVVDIQRRMMGLLPPMQVAGLDDAEALGKKGIVSFGGSQTSLADAAKAQNTTVEAMCKQMGSMIQAQADKLPK